MDNHMHQWQFARAVGGMNHTNEALFVCPCGAFKWQDLVEVKEKKKEKEGEKE